MANQKQRTKVVSLRVKVKDLKEAKSMIKNFKTKKQYRVYGKRKNKGA